MIHRVKVSGFRSLEALDFRPRPGLNLVVGANASGKSTLLEAIEMVLSGRANSRWVREALDPFWFHRGRVAAYLEARAADAPHRAPEIHIEAFLTSDSSPIQQLRGRHNSLREDCPGLYLRIAPAPDLADELDDYARNSGSAEAVLPIDYYDVSWRDFGGAPMTRRPRDLRLTRIDSRTVRATAAVDYHLREQLRGLLEPGERVAVAVAHRTARDRITQDVLGPISERIRQAAGEDERDLTVGLQMDQSAAASWETSVVPQLDSVPLAFAGQGHQAMVKVLLAAKGSSEALETLLIEEPENHLAHTTLRTLVDRLQIAVGERQAFVATHSSYVLNRLGLDGLRLLHKGAIADFDQLSAETVAFFQRLPGYDTLRAVLAERVVLVEGPSDEMLFARAFRDLHGVDPSALGVDIIAINGTSFARWLELGAALDRSMAAVRDNDGKPRSEYETRYATHLVNGKRQVFVGNLLQGKTLEAQIVKTNAESELRTILGLGPDQAVEDWMSKNKTEAALRLVASSQTLSMPSYLTDAASFVMT